MQKKLEVEVRIRHHAKKLTEFGALMKEILIPRPRVAILNNKVSFTNKNGTYLMRGYRVDGKYVGIKISKGMNRKNKVVKLVLV